MCGHYLVDPVACTPASGWEKGQVENQVGVLRRRFFVPRPKFKSFAELNTLSSRTGALPTAKAKPAPRRSGQDDLGGVYRGAFRAWCPMSGPFDGFHAVPASVLQDLPRALRQEPLLGSTPARSVVLSRYAPMPTGWNAGRMVRLSAAMIVAFGRDKTIYDPLHYIPGPGSQARRAAQWGAVQELVSATGPAPCAAQARTTARRRPASGRDPRGRYFCSPMAWTPSKPPAPRRSNRACIPRVSF